MTNDGLHLDEWFRFIGYGRPESWLWFVGMEEGGDRITRPLADDHDVYKVGGSEFTYDPKLPTGDNKVWQTAKDLAPDVGPGHGSVEYFLSNIAPLPRSSIKESHKGVEAKYYKEFVNEYHQRVVKKRIPLFVNRHRPAGSNVTVFHGKAAWRGYKVLSQFGLKEGDGLIAGNGLVVFEDEKLIFAPTFSWGERHFKKEQRVALIDYLAKWSHHRG